MLTRVMFARLGSNGALLFFSVAIGEETTNGPQYGLVIRDLVLRETNDGSKLFAALPSKQRTRKARGMVDGVEQQVLVPVIENGKGVYDQVVDLYYDGKGEERKATEFAWAIRKQIIDEATAVYHKLKGGDNGRGIAAEAPKEFARSTGARSSKSMFDDEEIPF